MANKNSSKKSKTEKKEVSITPSTTEKESEVKAGSTFVSPTPTMEVEAPTIKKLNSVDEGISKHNERPVERIFLSAKDHYKLNQLVDVKYQTFKAMKHFVK